MADDTKVLSGRYEIESELGHGGMAQVFLGTDRVLGRQVAVKVLGSQFAGDESFVARFRREAQSAAALNHPNVVNVFDTGSDDGTHFIVMEYVEGKTLAEVIREEGPLLPERAAEIIEAATSALAFAHDAGIVHRDVKPGNIMLGPGGEVKVMDFGIARATSSESLTQTATVLGTATYFSPEQAQGESVDARSDIYSLGCVFYEMLTGHPPFEAETPVAVAYKHVKENPFPPSRLNQELPGALDAIVLKCLAKNPANRYQSADDLLADLERFRADVPVLARPVVPMETTVVEGVARPTSMLPATATDEVDRPRRWVAVAILTAVLLILGVALFLLAQSLLSADEDLVTVPNVRGRTVPVATKILEDGGFERGRLIFRVSEEPKGIVIDYDPRAAERGASIDLVVSNGPTVELVAIPNVICEPEDQARDTLQEAGFKVPAAKQASNPNCLPGDVAKTEPAVGEQAPKGTSVQIFVVPEPSPTATTPSPTPTTPSPPPPTTPSPTPTTPPPPTTPSPTPTVTITPT